MSTHPDLEEFRRLAQPKSGTRPIVPIYREVLADSLTPVVAYATVGQQPGSFLLESVVGGEKWARYSIVGFEPEAMLRGQGDRFERVTDRGIERESGIDPWARLGEELSRYRPPPVDWLPRFWGGAVGYVAYDCVRRFEPTVGPPVSADKAIEDDHYDFSFAVGGTILVFDNLRQTLKVVVAPTEEDPDAAYANACARIERALERLRAPAVLPQCEPPDLTGNESLPPSSFARQDFCAAVERAKEYIRAGDIFQVVLSQRFRVPAEEISLYEAYRVMRLINPSPYMYFLRFPEVTIAGASPETLVRVEDRIATVRPIAGTRHRSADPAEDQRIEDELLADPKERAEHVMLVDLGRNDVGRISESGGVRVTDRMIIERYSHVMHIASNVEGRMAEKYSGLDALRATFPAGTLSGAPKVRAMQIIEELEPEPRGVYGGAVGYIGYDGNLDMAIAIRTLVARGDEVWLQAGAGIVEASDPEREYEETVNKARAGLVAVRAASRDPSL